MDQTRSARRRTALRSARLPGERQRARPMSADARRDQLLDCAIAVTAERGLGHARHSDIATRATVSVATVFHYYPTRPDLVAAVLAEVGRYLLEHTVGLVKDSTAPADAALTDAAMAFVDIIERQPDYVRVWLDWSTAVRADYWPAYLEFHQRAMTQVETIIERGKRAGLLDQALNIADEARVFVGIGHLVAQMKFAGLERTAIERTTRSFINGCLMRKA